MTNLYLCEYWNPQELITLPDPRLVVRQWGNSRLACVEFDHSVKVDPDSLLPRKEEVHSWKFGITTQNTAKKRNRHYVDTLVWEEFEDREQARLIERILIYLNAPFFNPNKIQGSSGEWIPLNVPAEIAIEFVNTEVQFARSHGMAELQARMNRCRDFYFDGDPNFGYWSPMWNPQRTDPITGEPVHAELLDRRDDYISRVKQWWEAPGREAVKPMW